MRLSVANIPPQFEIVDRPLDTQMTISMGPQHPSTHGVLRLELVLDGEMVVKATPDIGYLHTGMEKLFEYKKYQQGIVITDRMDYLNPLGNNLAYVMAVEKLLGSGDSRTRSNHSRADVRITANRLPPRLARNACARHRRNDRFLLLLPRARKDSESDRGCVRRAIDAFILPHRRIDDGSSCWFRESLQAVSDDFPTRVDEFHNLLTGNRIFQKRTQGIGTSLRRMRSTGGCLVHVCVAAASISTSGAQIHTAVMRSMILKFRLNLMATFGRVTWCGCAR